METKIVPKPPTTNKARLVSANKYRSLLAFMHQSSCVCTAVDSCVIFIEMIFDWATSKKTVICADHMRCESLCGALEPGAYTRTCCLAVRHQFDSYALSTV